MSGSSVVDMRRVRDVAAPGIAGWAGDGSPARRGQPAPVTEAVLGVGRIAFAISAASGGTAMPSSAPRGEAAGPVLAFVDHRTTSEPAGEMPRAAPARRRICTSMRLDAERRLRLGLVASFTGRSAQTVIVAALQAYLRDMISCPVAMREGGTSGERRARASSAARGSRRSLRLHPHLHWRLAIAARNARCSMQSILAGALDSYLDTVAPEISAEVFSCLMGWTDRAGVSIR